MAETMSENLLRSGKYTRRKMEWWLAASTFFFGLWIALPVASMATPAYSLLISWSSEDSWAFLFSSAGAVHLLALYINGSRWWTPMVRLVALVANTVAYAIMAAGFLVFYWPTTATLTYGVMTAAGMVCIYTATRDSAHAVRIFLSCIRGSL